MKNCVICIIVFIIGVTNYCFEVFNKGKMNWQIQEKKWHTDENWTTKSTCFEQPTTGLKLSAK